MTDHKFPDEELEKTLHICSHYAGNCSDYCPLRHDDECVQTMARHSRAVISRQKAEIERLNDVAERLQKHNRMLCMLEKMQINRIKAEAIKEFAENVKAIFECDFCFDADVTGYIINEIDETVKEMTEEHNESQNT